MGSFTARQLPALLVALCAAGAATPAAVHARQAYPTQSIPVDDRAYDAPAHVSLVDGAAILERDGEADDSPLNMPLLAGDRLRTRAGRVEILFADGSTLHLDHHTVIDLQSDELVRLTDGRIRLSIPGSSRDVHYRIDGPHGWVTISEPGDYRVALLHRPDGGELELAVLRGYASLSNEGGTTQLRAGERAMVRAGMAPSYAYVANSASWDAFDRWSEARRDERLRASATYLPDEVRPYAATFEQHGYWRHEPTYGAVWYPRVQPDWRPYYRGRWVSLRPYGWTWVAYDPWGWPTHHYGRWGYSSGAWFWIPGRHWSAAWVSWAWAGDYVSWCPLGWNNRPVFGLNININIGRGYDPWRGWTVVPRRHFGIGYVHRYVVRAEHLDDRVRSAFVARDRGPDWGGRAVPRASAPIHVAGARDGRRGGTPVYTNVPGSRSRVTADGPRVRVPDARAPRDAEAAAPRGARPNHRDVAAPSAGAARAVPRERATPDGPAVRSPRPVPPSPGERARPGATERYEVPTYRGGVLSGPSREAPPSGARPNDGEAGAAPRAVPRYGAPRDRGASPSVSPGPQYQTPSRERRVEPSTPAGPPPGYRAIPRGEPRAEPARPPAPAPSYRSTPRDEPRALPSRPSPPPAYRAAPRAEPRGEPSRPSAAPPAHRAAPRGEPRAQPSAPARPPSGARAVPRNQNGDARPSGGGEQRRQ